MRAREESFMKRLIAALLSIAGLAAGLGAAPASADKSQAFGACVHSGNKAARCQLLSDVDAKENFVPISWE